jgi:VIT1/CCC1 family predicted Fe2+/Mn2+ transporter
MNEIITQYELVVGVFLPLLIAFFIKEDWSAKTKVTISFAFVLLAAIGQMVVMQSWDPENLGRSILTILVLTITTYKGFWPLTGLTSLVEKKAGLTS